MINAGKKQVKGFTAENAEIAKRGMFSNSITVGLKVDRSMENCGDAIHQIIGFCGARFAPSAKDTACL